MTILRNKEVLLRPFELIDAFRMQQLANNEKVSRNLRDLFPHPYTLNDAHQFISKFLNQEPRTIFAIEYKGEYVGNIGLAIGEDVYRKSAEIGYFLGEPYWNLGIMTKAVNLITRYGFEEIGLARIHTGIFAFNRASMRVLEKCGYRREGIFRASVYKEGKLWDEYRYAKINPVHLSGQQD
jgi:RimJ/RimL family protein N-acetyltransferase